MKLESLKETKFKDAVLKRQQMFKLKGGGTATGGGTGLGTVVNGRNVIVDYGYDATRTASDGSVFITYHNFSNVKYLSLE